MVVLVVVDLVIVIDFVIVLALSLFLVSCPPLARSRRLWWWWCDGGGVGGVGVGSGLLHVDR